MPDWKQTSVPYAIWQHCITDLEQLGYTVKDTICPPGSTDCDISYYTEDDKNAWEVKFIRCDNCRDLVGYLITEGFDIKDDACTPLAQSPGWCRIQYRLR